MRILFTLMLLTFTTSVFAGGSGGGEGSPTPRSSGGAGGYSDYRSIVQYPLQSGLMIYKLTAYKYGW